MGAERMMESWFGGMWRTSCKSLEPEPDLRVIGIMTFEVASLMSKVANLWQFLSDSQMSRLGKEVIKSVGIHKLVSHDGDYLMDLVLAEVIDNLGCVANSVATLGKRCADPAYHHLEHIFDDPVAMDLKWCGWEYRLKKMDRRVKKMERFAAVTGQLYQELEVLAELEHSLRRMQANADLSKVKLLEFQQKVMWQRQEVKNLREMSPWIRTYDYTVRLLLRSLFTIVGRIKHVFGINHTGAFEESNDSEFLKKDSLVRSHSFSSLMYSSVHPSENSRSRLHSAPLGRSVSNLGLSTVKNRSNNKKFQTPAQSSILYGKHSQAKSRRLVHAGPLKGCMTGGTDSLVLQSCMPARSCSLRSSGVFQKDINEMKDTNRATLSFGNIIHSKLSLFNSKHSLLNAPSSSLGHAALALHYANIIILIEKLALSPHLISPDARDDLYDMLPSSIRTSLRSKLKLFSKTLASSGYDAVLAVEWRSTMARIFNWLAPLAHNMIRWNSEHNFEKQLMVSGVNILLVQTLYFANRAKTEAAVTELLMGLNYISRFGREINSKAFRESACSRVCDDYLLHKDNITHGIFNHTS